MTAPEPWRAALARLLNVAERLDPDALRRLAALPAGDDEGRREARARAMTAAQRLGREDALTDAHGWLDAWTRPTGMPRLDGGQFVGLAEPYAGGAAWEDLTHMRAAAMPLLLDAAVALAARDGISANDFERLYGPFRRAMVPAWSTRRAHQ